MDNQGTSNEEDAGDDALRNWIAYMESQGSDDGQVEEPGILPQLLQQESQSHGSREGYLWRDERATISRSLPSHPQCTERPMVAHRDGYTAEYAPFAVQMDGVQRHRAMLPSQSVCVNNTGALGPMSIAFEPTILSAQSQLPNLQQALQPERNYLWNAHTATHTPAAMQPNFPNPPLQTNGHLPPSVYHTTQNMAVAQMPPRPERVELENPWPFANQSVPVNEPGAEEEKNDDGSAHAIASVAASTVEASLAATTKRPAVVSSTTRPKKRCKPLTGYNYFYRDERDNIVQNMKQASDALPPPVCDFSTQKMEQLLHHHWHVDPFKEKRSHTKVHGKIKFPDLSKVIAIRWKALPESGRQFYRAIAKADHDEYDRYLEELYPSVSDDKKHDRGNNDPPPPSQPPLQQQP